MEQKVSSLFLPSYIKSHSQTTFEVTTSDYTWKIDQFGRLSAIVDTLNSPPFGENNQYKIQMDISRQDLLCAIRISIRTDTAFSGSCTTTIMHPPKEARSEATFRYTVKNISKMTDSQLSPAFYVCNLPWKIEVRSQSSQTEERQRSLGFYLQCDGVSESTESELWSCYAVAELRLLSCKEGQEPFSEKFSRKRHFNSESTAYGYSNFMTWQDVLDPDRGFIKDDSITLEAHVVADEVLLSRSISCLISDMTLLIDVSDHSYISTEAFIIHCKIDNFHKLINNTIHMNLQPSAPVFKEVKSLEFESEKSIKFIVGEEEYVISKKILCDTNSSYFKYICFTHKEKEKDMTNELVTDDEVECFKQILLYITTDSIDQDDQDDYEMLKKLLTAADKYDVPTLKLTCQHYLLRSLTIENAVELVQLAFSSNAKFLETHSVTFIKFHIKEIRDTETFESLSQEDLNKIMELIEKSNFEVRTDQFSLPPPKKSKI
ncbi:uncharacterized protein [Temnothorax nylanderi]|uniref:uncharacterized protein n=1 Tax=Temnothorax nylanderi TaxID=102681 RepID=UPI003A8427D4